MLPKISLPFLASGGYARTTLLENGTTLLATSQGGSPISACGLFATDDAKVWRTSSGPKFQVLPGSLFLYGSLALQNAAGTAGAPNLCEGMSCHSSAIGVPVWSVDLTCPQDLRQHAIGHSMHNQSERNYYSLHCNWIIVSIVERFGTE